MKKMTVTAKDGKAEGAPSATISVDIPETLDEAKAMFGDAAILSNAISNWTVTLQAAVRRAIKAGKKADEIAASLAGAKMGVAIERSSVDPKTAVLAQFAAMTPEEQAAYIKQLQEKAKAAKAQ